MAVATTRPDLEPLRLRAAAFAGTARMLGADVGALTDPNSWRELRDLLDRCGATRAATVLSTGGPPEEVDLQQLEGRWVRWFDLGRVAPYEGSNVPPTAGGITPRLADIAGFYAAFGLKIERDRPDHLVAELEFVGFLLAQEAEALAAEDDDQAAVAGDAIRTFLRDHLGTWVTAWAARVAAIDELAPWAPVAAATAALVHAECRDRHVIPVRHDAVLVGDAGIAPAEEADVRCGDPLTDGSSPPHPFGPPSSP